MQTDFYVSTNGSDSWDGTKDRPFVTLTKARDVARSLGKEKEKRIVLRGGSYFLQAPLILEPQDSGLTIEAMPGEDVILYGGKLVERWQKDGDKFWTAEAPTTSGVKYDFRMLLVNGRFGERARLPKEGTFTHLSEFNVPWMSSTYGGWKRKPTEDELTTLNYKAGDLGSWLEVANAEVTVYHMWDESCVGVAEHDVTAQTLKLSPPSQHPPGAFGVKKYVVWNIREGMHSPGRWYLDKNIGKIVYWPLPGEDMGKAKAMAPTTESIIHIAGNKEMPVQNITLNGLSFSVTTTPLEAGGFGANRYVGAVLLDFAQDCKLVNLTVKNVAGHGISASGCSRIRVENCEIVGTGAGGIYVGGQEAVIEGNHVHKVGLMYPSAIGIFRGGQNCIVRHNEVHDTSYSAINYGGGPNCIKYNLIYDAMKVLHDGAGIYVFGGKGSVLRGNFIRDIIDTGGYGASAYYLDEQSEGCVVEENLSLRVNRPSHNHMARKNTIRNNIFIVAGDAKITFPRCSDYTVERNVIYATGEISISNPDAIAVSSENLFYSGTGKIEGVKLKKDGYAADGITDGIPGDNMVADPMFVDLDKGDYRFKPESPALKLGIKQIDVSKAGRLP
ncbi:hypothetical protein FJZ31_16910 [Candidatus Poribacteria bacterium]|nr:hypothetical protein [Candidatus Poribacteria bacterium]